MVKIENVIIGVIILLAFIYFVIGFLFSIPCQNACENYCEGKNALKFDWDAGGGYLNCEEDTCICYFEDKIEGFRLNG